MGRLLPWGHTVLLGGLGAHARPIREKTCEKRSGDSDTMQLHDHDLDNQDVPERAPQNTFAFSMRSQVGTRISQSAQKKNGRDAINFSKTGLSLTGIKKNVRGGARGGTFDKSALLVALRGKPDLTPRGLVRATTAGGGCGTARASDMNVPD